MKRIIYIVSAVLLAYAASVSCERVDRPVAQGDGRPILFTADTEWPEITKATLYDRDDIMENGFKVWGNWHKDPEDPASYTFDADIFGEEGTLVSRQEGGDSMLPVKTAMWHRGYYCFAAVFPKSFSGATTSSFSKATSGNEYTNELTVDFGNAGFNLAEEQTDLMYAFADVDNSANQASKVQMDFFHTFALLDIRLTHKGADGSEEVGVKSVSLYGIHSEIKGNLQFVHNSGSTGVTADFATLLAASESTTEDNPYYDREFTDESILVFPGETIAIVDNLLVFPETLSEDTALTIKLVLMYGELTKEFTVTLEDGQWTSGSTNAYEISVDSSMFDTTE